MGRGKKVRPAGIRHGIKFCSFSSYIHLHIGMQQKFQISNNHMAARWHQKGERKKHFYNSCAADRENVWRKKKEDLETRRRKCISESSVRQLEEECAK